MKIPLTSKWFAVQKNQKFRCPRSEAFCLLFALPWVNLTALGR